MANLPLSDIVNVSVVVSPVSTVRNNFSLGLIVGKATVISGATRVVVYNSLAEMITAGFTTTAKEYIAAQLYFGQNPKPAQVAIGRWDGTGAETAAVAVTACRAANLDWYACMVCDATKAEIALIATYIEACTPASVHFYTTADADVLNDVAGNTLKAAKAAARRRTLGQYSTIPYAAASIMGYAVAASGGGAYTLKFKDEPSVTVETLTTAQLGTILTDNGNVYIARGNSINTFESGKMADGTAFDEVLGLDRLTNSLQIAVVTALKTNPKIPQTEDGISLLLNYLVPALEAERNRGFLAPGIWTAATILNLSTGDALNTGYVIQAGLISAQTQADRDNRIAPNIYVCVKLAGAVEKVALISINVNR